MPPTKDTVETTEYRLMLIEPGSGGIYAVHENGAYRIPSTLVPRWNRPGEELQAAIRSRWNLAAILLEILPVAGTSAAFYAIGEVLGEPMESTLSLIPASQLASTNLSAAEIEVFERVVARNFNEPSPLSGLGWIDDVVAWCEEQAGRRLRPKSDVKQFNVGGGFALLQISAEDNWNCWFKATGVPNVHEFSITRYLSKICGDLLPELIGTKAEWNAWLMSGEAKPVDTVPSDPRQFSILMENAVQSLAQLQIRTVDHELDLLDAGAFDQSTDALRRDSEELFDYLTYAMAQQQSAKAPQLTSKQLRDLREMLLRVCDRIDALDIPRTIIHGDLNPGNILMGAGHCQFIDWAECYIGNPVSSLQHLLMLNTIEQAEVRNSVNMALKESYRNAWTAICDPSDFNKAYCCMPFLAAVSALYARGDWFHGLRRKDPSRLSYSRTLARHMHRAAESAELKEALCR